MEPVTHFLTGACIGRAGLNRKTAYATLAGLLAAEAADLDVFWGIGGPVDELKHHRGITHTFWAVPVVAGVVVGAIWLLDRGLQARRARKSDDLNQKIKVPTAPPTAHWGWLYLTAFIAALSHILLDWTNNYGVRPFFPFNPRWYAGSFMYIAEPIIWALLLLAMIMPWLFGLTDREIGARRQLFRGRGWAIFALAGIVILGCWRWAEHGHARVMLDNTNVASERVTRIAIEPYPINPFRWHAILDTSDFFQTAEINTHTESIDSDPQTDVIQKPTDTPALEAAKRTMLGQVYLDWGTWAVVRDVGQEPVAGLDPPILPFHRTWTTIQFTDLRFQYPIFPDGSTQIGGGANSPLGGWVYIVDGRDDAGEIMNGRVQR